MVWIHRNPGVPRKHRGSIASRTIENAQGRSQSLSIPFFVREKGVVDLTVTTEWRLLPWTASTNSARASARFSVKRLDYGASPPMGDGETQRRRQGPQDRPLIAGQCNPPGLNHLQIPSSGIHLSVKPDRGRAYSAIACLEVPASVTHRSTCHFGADQRR